MESGGIKSNNAFPFAEMKLFPLTILLLALGGFVYGQNPSWEQFRVRQVERKLEELTKSCSDNQAKIAELEATLKYTDKLLWASITGTGVSGAIGAAALRRRKQT